MRIYLVGFMGVGKSTVGRALARRLDWWFVDLDRDIERRTGLDIPTLFAQFGEERFRQAESEALEAVATSGRAVVATGGGTFTRAANVEAIRRSGVSVWLDLALEDLLDRLERSPRVRPLFANREQAAELWSQRCTWYQQADLRIELSPADNPEGVTSRIVELLKERPCAI